MARKLKGAALAIALAALLAGQTPDALPTEVDRGAAGLTRWLHALGTRASILMVTAHPDDEDGGMLAYETRGVGARGMLLTLNRGEGGQNAMSADLYDALGLVRTQELLAADRYYGVDQYWTSAVDYGFSKTREEALEKWGHDRVLADVVRVIRMTRPLVVTSVFVGAATDGHGNHQVAGQMAQEAFEAAADPKRFPEQMAEGLRPWAPLKVYERTPFFDVTPKGMYDYAIDKYVPVKFTDYLTRTSSDKKPPVTLEIPEGTRNAAAGLTYLQIGREGLQYQMSQNHGGALPAPAPANTGYHRYGSRVTAGEKENSFYDGIDISVGGIATLANPAPESLKSGLATISRLVEQASAEYRPDHPEKIAPLLAEGLKSTRTLMERVRLDVAANAGRDDVLFELKAKDDEFQHALAEALGLSLQVVVAPDKEPTGPMRRFGGGAPSFTIAVPGQKFAVRVALMNESPEEVGLESIALLASDGKNWSIAPEKAAPQKAAPGVLTELRFAVTAPDNAALTRPYFSRPDEESSWYKLDEAKYRNQSLPPYPLAGRVQVQYRGASLQLSEVVQTSLRIPGIGVEPQPLIVGPAVSVTVSPAAGAIPVGAKLFAFACTVHSNVKGPAKIALHLKLPQGWTATPPSAELSTGHDGEERTVTFSVNPGEVRPGDHDITAVAEYSGRSYEEGYRLVGYPGLRPYPFYRPAIYKAVGVDVRTAPDLTVGYLPGTGDDVARALENLGVAVRILTATDVVKGDLGHYDAIVLGTRAYAARPELRSINSRLLDYVHGGGVLLVQYNLQDFDRNYGPYPFSLGDNPQKVVDEHTAVKVLQPDNAVFAWPNKITAQDFSGWVEERGHGFMEKWDPHYIALLETADPEQDPQRGGLLLAPYGKGAYIYDAFALYRQLPSGVPGAFRLLANLVSLGKNPEWLREAHREP